MAIAGIDVSHFNGAVNWGVAAHSVAFAFAKATQGTSFVDPRFAENWHCMREAGVQRGAYHFFDPSEDATAQANHFVETVHFEPGDLPPVLDVEMLKRSTLASTLDGITVWLAAVHKAIGRTPIVYTSASFWQQLGNPPNPGPYPLWVAHYGVPKPHVPTAWPAWTFWQFSQLGRCAGITGYVDMNRYRGSTEEMSVLCGGCSTP